MASEIAAYPARMTFAPDDQVARWRVLGNLVLAIPHLLVLQVVQLVTQVLALVSWTVILVTGRLPQGIADVQCMALRYALRTQTYIGFLAEAYPPFELEPAQADPASYGPVRLDVVPELEDRNRVTVLFRLLLALPHFVALAVVGVGAFVCWLIAFFAVLVTGRWPEGLRDFVLGVLRWGTRFQAYLNLLTDEYPPFSLD